MPSVGLYFGVYSYCKRRFLPHFERKLGGGQDDDEDRNEVFVRGGKRGKRTRTTGGRKFRLSDPAIRSLAVAASAVVGNTVASFSRVPYEVVKQNLQTGLYPDTLTAFSSMWRANGMRAFFPPGGVSSQMVRDIPYAVLTLLAYEALRENWVRGRTGPFYAMVSGGLSGGWGSWATNPLDVIKTRLQTDASGTLYGGSVMRCAALTYEEGGGKAFLRGSLPRLMHKIPANSCFFLFYELFRRLLKVEGAGADS